MCAKIKFISQDKLEAYQCDEGRASIIRAHSKALEQEATSRSPMYAKIISSVIKEASNAIDFWRADQEKVRASNQYATYKAVKGLPSPVIAQLVLSASLNGALNPKGNLQMQVSRDIGSLILKEIQFREFVRQYPEDYKSFRKQNKSKNRQHMITFLSYCAGKHNVQKPKDDKTRIGLDLFSIVNNKTGLFVLNEVILKNSKYKTYKVELDERLVGFANAHYDRLLNRAHIDLPMVEVPTEWTRDTSGGYSNLYYNLVPHNRLAKKIQAGLSKTTFDAINAIQRTAFRVNRAVLDRVNALSEDLRSKLVPSELELPEKLGDDATIDEIRNYRNEAKICYTENVSIRSKQYGFERTLKVADMFKDNEAIYFPVFADYRLRLYTKCTVLTPQGSDLSKGLIEFANGKQVTDIKQVEYLLLHGANLYGLKGSREEKLNAIKGLQETVFAIVEGSNDWLEASEPVQFLAFCYEYYKLLNEGLGYTTHLPVAVDASCSGSQILSIILRDKTLAKATNVLPSDKPQDVYIESMYAAYEYILENIQDMSPAVARIVDLVPLDRDCMKRPCMCFVYSLTKYGANDYVGIWFVKKSKDVDLSAFTANEIFEARRFYCDAVWAGVNKVQNSAARAMKFFQECARSVVDQGILDVSWDTPLRNTITQQYRDYKARVVQSNILGKTISTLAFDELEDKAKKSRHIAGIAPNVVHSLDASVLHEAVARCSTNGINNFGVVHDSYGSTCVEIDSILNELKEVYISLFESNFLESFRQNIRDQVGCGVKLPKLPELGDLDLNDIRESVYMFS